MHVKLLNVARSSIQELREDYRDYLKSRKLPLWNYSHSRFKRMLDFCRSHNRIEDYQPFFEMWNAEEMANIALTLCYMTDSMLNRYLKTLEVEFVEKGGIRERMYAARTNYRQVKEDEIIMLKKRIKELEEELECLKKNRHL